MPLRINPNNIVNNPNPDEQAYLNEIKPLIDSSNNKEEIIKSLESFIVKHPYYALAYNNLAVFYYESGLYEKALDNYKKAYELAPDNTAFIKNLADYYFVEVGDIENALKLYIKALEIDSEDVEVYLILGNICANIGKIEDARFFYDKVLEIEPWNLTAMDNLDYLDEINK